MTVQLEMNQAALIVLCPIAQWAKIERQGKVFWFKKIFEMLVKSLRLNIMLSSNAPVIRIWQD